MPHLPWVHKLNILWDEYEQFAHICMWIDIWWVSHTSISFMFHIMHLFSLLLCSLWWVQIFGYVLTCRSYSFVCTVHHLIIIIVQTYLKPLNLWNVCQIYFVECVSKNKHILSVIHHTICEAVCFSVYPFLLWWLREYIYFVLISSSNRKYELLPIV